jgi:hypothetical protein
VSYAEEFSTVDLIVASGADTLGVDAFALSLIKAERQARKLFTFLIYQSRAFRTGDGKRLRAILAANKRVYFEGVVAGLDALSPIPVKELVGPEFDRLWESFREFGKHRNKIFHGQLTADGLSRDQLLKNVKDIRLWCSTLGSSATRKFGCDGFVRNSFQKSPIEDLYMRLRVRIESLDQSSDFIHSHIER